MGTIWARGQTRGEGSTSTLRLPWPWLAVQNAEWGYMRPVSVDENTGSKQANAGGGTGLVAVFA